MSLLNVVAPRRKLPIVYTSIFADQAHGRQVAPGSGINPTVDVLLGSVPQKGALKRPLSAKQGTTSTTLQPTHTFPVEDSNEGTDRLDALASFATSIGANQPAATVVDRARMYAGDSTDSPQVVEVEGRALPAAAYLIAHLYQVYTGTPVVSASDSALANNATRYAYYKFCAGLARRDYLAENILKVQPFTGTGALSTYSEDDGGEGRVSPLPELGTFFVGRTLTVNQVGLARVRAFLIASANDMNVNTTIRAGGRGYVPEEVNSIEDQIMDELGTGPNSITGTAAAAPTGHGVRGQPQDPFTGAGVFMFADMYDTPKNVSIVFAGAAQTVQVVAISERGLDAVRSA